MLLWIKDSFCFLLSYIAIYFLVVNGEQEQEAEEEEDEEELYEFASLPNGETSDVSSEAEGGQGGQQSELSDSNENETASCQSETTLDLHRALIEEIRFVPICHYVTHDSYICCIRYDNLVLPRTISLPKVKLICVFSRVSFCVIFCHRKNEFGIGVELNAEGQKLMQVHQERLGRSLDRLSTELYSKDTHFVLELIQVASITFTSCQHVISAVVYLPIFIQNKTK